MTDLYRKNIGIMIVNDSNKVLVGKRIEMPSDAWQMPQGGIDEGETPQEALFRELFEETGISKNNICIISEASDWLSYDFPADLKNKLWNGNYKGQKQKWFLCRFIGTDKDINLNATNAPEFSEYKWVDAKTIPSLAISFKKDVYQKLLDLFKKELVL